MLTKPLNWRSLDLNLLVVFAAVAKERSITRAAATLNMTQPGISHAIGRLRSALRDELFVRTPDGMDPTPYATRLAEPVQAALHSLGLALEKATAFEPGLSASSFTIAVNNRSAVVLVSDIATKVHALAPGIRLEFLASGTVDLLDQLDRGQIDLALGGQSVPAERFCHRRLYDEGFTCLVQRGHPAASDEQIDLHALACYPHLTLSSTGEDASFVDVELGRHGLARDVVLRAPLHSAVAILARSQMIAVVSERVAQHLAATAPLQVLALPFDSPRMNTALIWHRRLNDVPAHQWLRTLITTVAALVQGPQQGQGGS